MRFVLAVVPARLSGCEARVVGTTPAFRASSSKVAGPATAGRFPSYERGWMRAYAAVRSSGTTRPGFGESAGAHARRRLAEEAAAHCHDACAPSSSGAASEARWPSPGRRAHPDGSCVPAGRRSQILLRARLCRPLVEDSELAGRRRRCLLDPAHARKFWA